MAETFPNFKPEYNYSASFETKKKVVALGDGYQHRSLFGLPQNQIITSADLTFNVSKTEAEQIFTFLRNRDLDQKSFLFTLPDETTAKNFICIGQRKTIPYLNRTKILLKFQQVFES